jgi:glycerophosphoryl diester phosphodiesterase
MVDIELKEDGYVGEAMAVVTGSLPAAGYVVTSFLDSVLTQVREAAPQARTGLLVRSGRGLGRLAQRVARAEVDFLAPQLTLARSGLLEWAAQRGLPAWVWTVNASDARRALLFDPRVEAVITDHARDAVAEAGEGPDRRVEV